MTGARGLAIGRSSGRLKPQGSHWPKEALAKSLGSLAPARAAAQVKLKSTVGLGPARCPGLTSLPWSAGHWILNGSTASYWRHPPDASYFPSNTALYFTPSSFPQPPSPPAPQSTPHIFFLPAPFHQHSLPNLAKFSAPMATSSSPVRSVPTTLAPHCEKPTGMKLPLDIPHFLINPLDGEFTPYTNCTPASSPTEEGEPSHDYFSVATMSPTAATTSIRSRAASIAYQKILEHQTQIMSGLCAAWRLRFPQQPIETPKMDHPALCENSKFLLQTHLGQPHQSHRMRSHTCEDRTLAAAATERLSLCDGHSTVVDVQKWKAQAVEEKDKRSAIIAWLSLLTLAEHTDEAEAPAEWPEPCVV